MNVEVVISRKDAVGATIKSLGYSFREVDEDVVDFSGNFRDPVVVISRHESSSKKPSITVHTPGNPTKATMGGRQEELAIAYPRLLRAIFLELMKIEVDIEKTVEATHHGPTSLDVPVVFVEIGSDETYWRNETLVRKLVEATLRGINAVDSVECNEVVTIYGGPHYSYTAVKRLLSGECVAHVISKHYVGEVSSAVIKQSVERSVNTITKVVFDNVNRASYERISSALSDKALKFEKI